jgi:hypothetical protein
MKWVQPIAQSKGLTVRNFQSDWQNGMVFCAILHDYFPHLIDFNSLNPDNKEQNLQKAFAGFEKVGIPALLDAVDIAVVPEKLSILTYLGHLQSRLGRRSKGSFSMSNGIDEIISLGKSPSAPGSPAQVSSPSLEAPAPVRPVIEPEIPNSHSASQEHLVDSDVGVIGAIETAPLQSLTGHRAVPPGRRQPTRTPSSAVMTGPYVPPPMDSPVGHVTGDEESVSNGVSAEIDASQDTSSSPEEPTEKDFTPTTGSTARHPGGFSLFGTFDPSKNRLLRAPSQAVGSSSSAPDEITSPHSTETITPRAPNVIQEAIDKVKSELESKHLEALRALKLELAASKRDAEEARQALEAEREMAEKFKAQQQALSESQLESRLVEQRKTSDEAYNKLKAEFEAYRGEKTSGLEASRAEFESLLQQHQNLIAAHKQLQDAAAAHEKATSDQQASNQASTASAIATLESQVAQLKEHLEASQKNASQAQELVQASEAKVKGLLEQLDQEREKSSQTLISLQQAENAASLGTSASHAEVSQLKEALERQSKNHETEKRELLSKMEQLEASFVEAKQAQEAEYEAERTKLKRAMEAIDAEKLELQQIHQAAVAERQKAEIALERVQTERSLLESHRTSVGTSEAPNNTLIEAIAATREELATLQKLVETNSATTAIHNDSISSKLATLDQDAQSAKEPIQRASQLANEMVVIRTKLRELDSTTSKLKATTETNVEAFTAAISGLQNSNNQLNERITPTQLEPIISSIVAHKLPSVVRSSTSQLESTINTLSERINSLENENQLLKKQIETVATSSASTTSPTASVSAGLSADEIKALIEVSVANALQQQQQQAPQKMSGRSLPPTPAAHAAPRADGLAAEQARSEDLRREQEEKARAEATLRREQEKALALQEQETQRRDLLRRQLELERQAMLDAQERAQREANMRIEVEKIEEERRMELRAARARAEEEERARMQLLEERARMEQVALETEKARLAKLAQDQADAAAEAARQDQVKREAAAAEAARQEQLNREAAAAETARQEQFNREAAAVEAARQEQLNREASAAEAARQEQLKREADAERIRQEAQREREEAEARTRQAEEAERTRLAQKKKEAEELALSEQLAAAERAKQAQLQKEAEERARIEQDAKRLVAASQPAQSSPGTKKSLFDDVFDFSAPTTKTASPTGKKVSLFDDDDDDDLIFGAKKTSTPSTPAKKKSIFDDDDDDSDPFKPKTDAKKTAAPKSFLDRLTSAFN